MRLPTVGLSLGIVFGATACGDDTTKVKPDAPVPIDAAVDAMPPRVFKGYDADESGEVKVEYLLFPNGNAGGRVQAFVMKNPGSPAYHPFFTLNACTKITQDQGLFPTAQNADREYVSPGLVLISDPTGVVPTMTLKPNAAAGKDSAGRSHPAGMYTVADAAGGPFMGSASTSGSTYFPEKYLYDVTFTGSADLPAQTFKGALWMPAAVTLTNPPMGTYQLLAGVDQTVEMTVPANEDGMPAGSFVREFVAFTGAMGITYICVDELIDNKIKITAAAADLTRATYPTGGTMARLNTNHIVRELVDNDGPTGRRIDFVSNWCNATPFAVP